MKHYNIPIFVPHLGCPNDCVFCNQKRITGVDTVDYSAIKATIESYLKSFTKKAIIEIAFFGGSFTGIPVEEQNQYLDIAKSYIESGQIDGIRLSTRPDYIDIGTLRRLKSYGVTAIELGVQSLDAEVISASKRGHDISCVEKACQMIKSFNIELGLQMMIGLPEDTLEKSWHTCQKIIELQPATVRIYPTLVIQDTELEDMFHKGNYQPLTLDQAIDEATILYEAFIKAGIQVIKLGLHPSEDLQNGSIIAGPFHPAFRQLIESRRWLKLMQKHVHNDCIIYANRQDISNVIGQRKSNIKILRASGLRIEVKEKTLNRGTIEINGLLLSIK